MYLTQGETGSVADYAFGLTAPPGIIQHHHRRGPSPTLLSPGGLTWVGEGCPRFLTDLPLRCSWQTTICFCVYAGLCVTRSVCPPRVNPREGRATAVWRTQMQAQPRRLGLGQPERATFARSCIGPGSGGGASVVVTAQPLPIDDRPEGEDDHEGEGGDGAEAQGHAALNQMYKEINMKKGPCQGLGKASQDPNDLVKNNRSLGGAKEDGVPRTNQRATRGQTKIPTLTVTQ